LKHIGNHAVKRLGKWQPSLVNKVQKHDFLLNFGGDFQCKV